MDRRALEPEVRARKKRGLGKKSLGLSLKGWTGGCQEPVEAILQA